MIIVPELETIVILPPRTGSGSLKHALLETYPQAMMLYRHMEADGVPMGYDRWRKVGVCRHPIDRLHSLYRFCQPGEHGGSYSAYPAAWRKLNESVDRPFEDWLIHNEVAFSHGYCRDGAGFTPQFASRHVMAENRKSQFIYLRPDLGTEILKFGDWKALEARLGVQLGHRNSTGNAERPMLSSEALRHIITFHRWDLENC